jgi:hypothetical protein
MTHEKPVYSPLKGFKILTDEMDCPTKGAGSSRPDSRAVSGAGASTANLVPADVSQKRSVPTRSVSNGDIQSMPAPAPAPSPTSEALPAGESSSMPDGHETEPVSILLERSVESEQSMPDGHETEPVSILSERSVESEKSMPDGHETEPVSILSERSVESEKSMPDGHETEPVSIKSEPSVTVPGSSSTGLVQPLLTGESAAMPDDNETEPALTQVSFGVHTTFEVSPEDLSVAPDPPTILSKGKGKGEYLVLHSS